MTSREHVLYLIDASSYVYRAYFALPPLTNTAGIPIQAVYGFTSMLLKLQRTVQPKFLAVVFDAPGETFRDALYPEYKAHRPGMPEELRAQWPLVQEVVETLGIYSLSRPGFEADDVIASLADRAARCGFEVVVITGDKDLMQIVTPQVRVWDTMKDRWFDANAVRQRYGVEPEQIVDLIGLMGDTVDNIPGVDGIGEKTARVLLERFGSIEAILSRLDEVAKTPGLRGAGKVAERLQAGADQARVSRELATVRRDIESLPDLEQFRFTPAENERVRSFLSRQGFQKLMQSLPESPAAPGSEGERLADRQQAQKILDEIETEEDVALAVSPGGLALATRRHTVFVEASAFPPCELFRAVVAAGAHVVGHDVKTDLRTLGEVDFETGAAFDVMVASYLTEATASHRLDELAREMLGVSCPDFRAGAGQLARGVSLLPKLAGPLREQLRERGVDDLFRQVEMPLVGVLARMEQHGVRLDLEALRAFAGEVNDRLDKLAGQIFELAGGPFHIASPVQLRAVLFERLGLPARGIRRGKTGLSTDVDALNRLAAEHPLPALVLEHRALAKLKSTYVDALPLAVNPATGRVHPRFNQCVTATGRLSCSDPNLQNIPVRGEDGQRLRAAFVAGPGCLLLVADYSQIELRILAHLSGDPVLLDAFRRGEDIHARTAAEIFGCLPGTVSRDMRRAAKVINFGVIYGMGATALAREIGVPTKRAEEYIQSYFERHVGVREYFEGVCNEARQSGYVTTMLGRRRSLPEIRSKDRNLAQAAERTAMNTPIQGSAADLIKMAMIRIDTRIRSEALKAAMILQIHDELVFEVAEAQCEPLRKVVQEEMQGAASLQVPLVVDLGVGQDWAEAHR